MSKNDALLMEMLQQKQGGSSTLLLIVGGIVVIIVVLLLFMRKKNVPDVPPLPSNLPKPTRKYKKREPTKTKPDRGAAGKVVKDVVKKTEDVVKDLAKKAAAAGGSVINKVEKTGEKIIDQQVTGPCAKYHTFPAWYQLSPGETCSKFPPECQAECLDTQKKFCKKNYKCAVERGVPPCKEKKMCVDAKTKKPIPCPCYTLKCDQLAGDNVYPDYQVAPKAKEENSCGGKTKGGASCKSNCCSAQWNKSSKSAWPGCRVAAGGSRVECMADRGCDVNSNTTFGSGFKESTFCNGLDYRVAPTNSSDQKCGGYKKGSSRCKKKCCDTQWNKNPHWAGCKNVPDPVLCMKQRGCSSKGYLKKLPTLTKGKFTPHYKFEIGNHRGVFPATLCQSNMSSGGYCRECLANSDCDTGCCAGFKCKKKVKKAGTCYWGYCNADGTVCGSVFSGKGCPLKHGETWTQEHCQ